MPPKRSRNLDAAENAELKQALQGENGYGVPRRILGYDIYGNAPGRLAGLFDWNAHPKVEDPPELLFNIKELDFGAMSPSYWERLLERWRSHPMEWVFVNVWHPNRRTAVYVYKSSDGAYLHFPVCRWDDGWGLLARTDKIVWKTVGLRAERTARKQLQTKLSRQQNRQLVLTNSFVELGRSGVRYLIRHGRPTIAYREEKVKPGRESIRFLAALCLHPLGYYQRTFAGCMVPSDEMLSHLLLIRSDERDFWRKANQHRLDSALTGIG